MRSSASARHISATPSWLESAYSCNSPSTSPRAGLPRSATVRFSASARANPAAAAGSAASASRAGRHSGSGRR